MQSVKLGKSCLALLRRALLCGGHGELGESERERYLEDDVCYCALLTSFVSGSELTPARPSRIARDAANTINLARLGSRCEPVLIAAGTTAATCATLRGFSRYTLVWEVLWLVDALRRYCPTDLSTLSSRIRIKGRDTECTCNGSPQSRSALLGVVNSGNSAEYLVSSTLTIAQPSPTLIRYPPVYTLLYMPTKTLRRSQVSAS